MATKFTRTEKQSENQLRGQAALVMAALESFGSGATVEEMTPVVVDAGLKTRQDPARIVSYYMAVFKKQGLVTSVRETPAPAAEPVSAEELVDAAIAAADEATTEELIEEVLQ